MTETKQPDAGAHEGFHALADAERLLDQAEQDPSVAPRAAAAALRALLQVWAPTPPGERVSDLLRQAAETDDTLAELMPEAGPLDDNQPDEAHARAKVFVDAARGRLANI